MKFQIIGEWSKSIFFKERRRLGWLLKIKQKVKRKPKAGRKKVKIIAVPLGTGEINIQTTES